MTRFLRKERKQNWNGWKKSAHTWMTRFLRNKIHKDRKRTKEDRRNEHAHGRRRFVCILDDELDLIVVHGRCKVNLVGRGVPGTHSGNAM